jgi:hypothetical protein
MSHEPIPQPVCPGVCTSKVAVLEHQIKTTDHRLDRIDEKLDRILEQTTKTNGSVGRLQTDMKDNFDSDDKVALRVTELEKGNVKLWLIVGGAASVISSILPLILKYILP